MPNKFFQTDQIMRLQKAQKPREHTLAAEEMRYVTRMEQQCI